MSFKKILFILTLFLVLLPILVNASTATCEYKYSSVSVLVYYEYGKPLTSKVSDSKYSLKSIDLNNADLVDAKNGNISCPKVMISSRTVSRQRWEFEVTKDLTANGVQTEGQLKDFNDDGKEKNQPLSSNVLCVYHGNTDIEYTLMWDGNKVDVTLNGSRYNNFCSYQLDSGFSQNDFNNNSCPTKIYDQIIIKAEESGKKCRGKIIISKEAILTEKDNPVTPSNIINPNNVSNVISTTSFGNSNQIVSCEAILSKDVQTVLKNILNFVKYFGPILVMAFTILDLIKAAVSGEAGEPKKISIKFIKRLIAAALLFFLPMLVNLLFRIFNINISDCSVLGHLVFNLHKIIIYNIF